MARPDLSRVFQYFHRYINLVSEDDLMISFKNQTPAMVEFFQKIPRDKIDYAYAEGKWTIREVLQHIIDAERIFSYRALSFARKDAGPLPGFDENKFAETAKAGKRDWNELIDEFKTVRKSTEYLYGSFDDEQLNSGGIASGNPNYVLGFAYITIGHTLHHMKIIKERYL